MRLQRRRGRQEARAQGFLRAGEARWQTRATTVTDIARGQLPPSPRRREQPFIIRKLWRSRVVPGSRRGRRFQVDRTTATSMRDQEQSPELS